MSFLLIFLLVAYHIPAAQSQGTPAPKSCKDVRERVDSSGVVGLDSNAISALDNGVQGFFDCMPDRTTVRVSDPKWRLNSGVEIKRPVTIEGQGTAVQCPSDTAHTGPAISIMSDDVLISGFVFSGCNLNNSAGLLLIEGSKNVTLKDMQFEDNKNTAGPGCIMGMNSTIQMQNITAINNIALYGGAVSITEASKVAITNSWLENNNATEQGGAIFLQNSDLNISDSGFNGNSAYDDGGAIYAQGEMRSEVKIEAGGFIGNRVYGEYLNDWNWRAGGAVALVGPQLNAEIIKSTFVNNSAINIGGAISMFNGTNASIHDSDFIENSAFQGGAIYVMSTPPNMTTLMLNTCLFHSNYCRGSFKGFQQSGGAIVMFDNGVVATIKKTNLTENKAEVQGGAVYAFGIRELEFSGATFLGNVAGRFDQVSTSPISDTVYPMYKAFIEPDLMTAHLRIYNTINPFTGFMNATYILKAQRIVPVEDADRVLEGSSRTNESVIFTCCPPMKIQKHARAG